MAESPMERGQKWLQALLQLTGAPAQVVGKLEATANPQTEEPDSYWLTINHGELTPEQIQLLIGRDGAVLDAIQYLANSTLNINQAPELQAGYTIELNGYRVRRQAEVRAIAETAAEQARTTGQEVEIRSLSSVERREVHTFLKEFTDLETFSRGKEPQRNLVVRLASLM
ncbi:Jag family protein [Calothrix sp. 336/3]|uniref:Jag family protein n=1 Tax=Calothrix sp. 336/3 TaxID=1337936 RepID=UPI0004E30BEC|nr:R3H domain-containing nucleic acid-binding protein [Calothrix sp. 336/3]